MAFKPYRPKPAGARPPGSRPSGGRFNRGPRPPEHNINNFIRANEVRLVGDNLQEISDVVGEAVETGVFSTSRLQKWAEEVGLDLVEITPNADPPIVRIVDYNKFLYQKRKREKELKASTAKVELKEIRFGPETGDHDFDFKLRHAKNFLSEGNKVKAYVQFRGRAIVFKERGELLLLRFMKELEEHGVAEQLPKLEGKRMMVIMSPKKASGSPKKGDSGSKKGDAGAKKADGAAKKTDGAPKKVEEAAQKAAEAPNKVEEAAPKTAEAPKKVEEAAQKAVEAPKKVEEAAQKTAEAPKKAEEVANKADDGPTTTAE